MKSLVVILGLLVAAVQAAPGETFPDDLTPLDVYMPVIEGAAEVQAPKIIGGQPALPCQFPFLVAIVINTSGFCGGSLLSPTWVLTAAHCGNAGSTFQVILGRTQWQGPGGVVVTTTQRIEHPNYNPSTLANNIALLRIPAVTFTNCIQPVRLPTLNAGTFVGVTALFCGWGSTTQTGGVSPILNCIEVVILSNAVCDQTFGTNIITTSTICGRGAAGRCPCNGDRGGTLVIRGSDGNFTLIGVLRFSPCSCAVGDPLIFTRVTSFRTWIQSHTGL